MARDKVVIGMALPPGMTAAYAYFSAASALGYDREVDVEFDFFYGHEPAATAQSLTAGDCTLACLNTIVGLIGRDRGLPMRAIGSKARRTHRWFAVVPASPIRTLADLRGKRIACDFTHLQALGEAALAAEGIAAGDIAWVPWRGSGTEAARMVGPLQRGEVDAIFVIDWNLGDFEAEGLALRLLPARLLDRIRASSCYWVTEDELKMRGEVMARAAQALGKSLAFGFADPEAAVQLMWERHRETRPAAPERARIARRDLAILKVVLEPMRVAPEDPDPRLGAIDAAALGDWHDYLVNAGTIRRLDVAQAFTTAYINDFNRFDAAAFGG